MILAIRGLVFIRGESTKSVKRAPKFQKGGIGQKGEGKIN